MRLQPKSTPGQKTILVSLSRGSYELEADIAIVTEAARTYLVVAATYIESISNIGLKQLTQGMVKSAVCIIT